MPNTDLDNNANNNQYHEDQPVICRDRFAQEGHDDFSSQQHRQDDDGPIEKGSYQDQPDNGADDVDHPIPGTGGHTQGNCQ